MINTNELEKKLKNIAETIIGDVGCPTEMRYSITGEEYTEIGIQFKEKDEPKLLSEWLYAIYGLIYVSKLRFFCKIRNINDYYKPKLYWRKLPEITEHPDKDMYNFYARLLISCNYELEQSKKVRGINDINEFHIEELTK